MPVLERVLASTRFTMTAQAKDGAGAPFRKGLVAGRVPGITTE